MNSKFRVWDGDEMHEPPHRWIIGANGNLYQVLEREQHGVYQLVHDDTPVMQYTGLDDAEGAPVYEGDIVRILGGDLLLVRWHRSAFRVGRLPIRARNKLEVAGNKFQTPELLD